LAQKGCAPPLAYTKVIGVHQREHL